MKEDEIDVLKWTFLSCRTQEDNDFLFAKALQESEQEEARRNRRQTVSIPIHSSSLSLTMMCDFFRVCKVKHNLCIFLANGDQIQ